MIFTTLHLELLARVENNGTSHPQYEKEYLNLAGLRLIESNWIAGLRLTFKGKDLLALLCRVADGQESPVYEVAGSLDVLKKAYPKEYAEQVDPYERAMVVGNYTRMDGSKALTIQMEDGGQISLSANDYLGWFDRQDKFKIRRPRNVIDASNRRWEEVPEDRAQITTPRDEAPYTVAEMIGIREALIEIRDLLSRANELAGAQYGALQATNSHLMDLKRK